MKPKQQALMLIIILIFLTLTLDALYEQQRITIAKLEEEVAHKTSLIEKQIELQDKMYKYLLDIVTYSEDKQEVNIIDPDKLKWFIDNYEWLKDEFER